tara:strand:+ start:698 stop:964 length:267 start_codon:yes stop_codon:yes gene_type:complete
MKGDGFKPEQEFRLIYGDNNSKSQVHHLSFPAQYINRIIINPWIPHGLVPAVKAALRSAMGDHKPRIEVSNLIDSEQWAEALHHVDLF